jgi:hypothetical protein
MEEMVMFFKKKQRNDEEDPLSHYQRLVKNGEDTSFLDIDTTLVISLRDDIDDLQRANQLTTEQLKKLSDIDQIFIRKAGTSLEVYEREIKQSSPRSTYLTAVLKDLRAYGKGEPIEKWWFHIVSK